MSGRVAKLACSSDTYEPYIVNHPRDLPLVRCKDEKQTDLIAFTSLFNFPFCDKKFDKVGQYIDIYLLPLYHNYVLWSYAVRITRDKGNNYLLSVVSYGPHLEFEQKEKKGTSNDLPGLTAPTMLYVNVWARKNKKVVGDWPISPPDTGNISLTKKELTELKGDDSNIELGLTIVVRRSYFSLTSIIDLNAKVTVPVGARTTAEEILCGMKPHSWDWEITAGCKCAPLAHKNCTRPVYYVHKEKFTRISSDIQKALCGRAQNRFELLKGGKRGKLSGMSNDGLRLAMYIAYGVDVPLPERGQTAKEIFTGLNDLFGCHLLNVVIPQWEREICNKALALDKSNLSSSMPELLHLLNLIWEAPYGWFPVAKRVAIGVLADMAHLNIRSTLNQWVNESVISRLKEARLAPAHIVTLLVSFYRSMSKLPYVEKRGIGSKDCEEHTEREENEEEDDGWYDDFLAEKKRNPCSCSIS